LRIPKSSHKGRCIIIIKDNIVKLDKCFKCRLNRAERCEGQYAVKGSILITCPYYIDYRDEKKNIDKTEIPYEKISKRKKKIK